MMSQQDFTDLSDNVDIPIVKRNKKEHIIEDAINYITVHRDAMFYPGKTYAIAIMYASWIEDEFGGEFYDILDDSELLFDDEDFVPYSKDKETYDKIIRYVDWLNDNAKYENLPYLKQTRQYFEQEFMLDDNGLKILPR